MKIIKTGLKWVHMGRYELILRLDGALWLTIIFKPLLTPQRGITIQFWDVCDRKSPHDLECNVLEQGFGQVQ